REGAAMNVDRISRAAEEAGSDSAGDGTVAETPQLAGQVVGREPKARVKLERRCEDLGGKVPMPVVEFSCDAPPHPRAIAERGDWDREQNVNEYSLLHRYLGLGGTDSLAYERVCGAR